MLLTGIRYLNKKKKSKGSFYDWLLTLIILLFSLAFIGYAILNFLSGNMFGLVFFVFGGIGLIFSYQDYLNYLDKSNYKNYYLIMHLQRMMGSYIACTTAPLVVNNILPIEAVAWLLPSIIIIPLIVIWTKKYIIKII